MTTIYYAHTADFIGTISLVELLSKLPIAMHERALRYRFEADAYDFVLGRLLLKKGLEGLGLVEQFEQVKISENGKPFLENVHFNISHTAGLIVAALSTDNPIGIDVECRKEVDLLVFEAWFTTKEWQDIQIHSKPMERFFGYWTRKESIIKALGLKLSDLNQLDFDAHQDSFVQNETTWYLQDLDFGTDYWGCICSPSSAPIRNFVKLSATAL